MKSPDLGLAVTRCFSGYFQLSGVVRALRVDNDNMLVYEILAHFVIFGA